MSTSIPKKYRTEIKSQLKRTDIAYVIILSEVSSNVIDRYVDIFSNERLQPGEALLPTKGTAFQQSYELLGEFCDKVGIINYNKYVLLASKTVNKLCKYEPNKDPSLKSLREIIHRKMIGAKIIIVYGDNYKIINIQE